MKGMETFNNHIANPETDSINETGLQLAPEQVTKYTTIYKDKNTGEIFYKISKRPEEQRFISMILKGIMNTADIVQYKGEYYSHQQNMDQLTSEESFSKDEIEADRFILGYIFSDSDHKEKHTTIPNKPGEWDTYDYENIAIDKNSNKKYYYDFEAARLDADRVQSPIEIQYFKNYLANEDKLKEYSPLVEILNKKSKTELDTIFNENNFALFEAIVTKSNIVTEDGDKNSTYSFLNGTMYDRKLMIKELFNDLKNRFQCLYEVTEELKKETKKQ